jgi:hypothetical protein
MKLILVVFMLTLYSQNILATPFEGGYYYTRDGKKTEGLIKFSRATFSVFGSKPCHIMFKENEEGKTIKLTVDDISSFVIGKDSFTLVYNIKINSIQGEYVKDFAKVVVSGRVNLFIHMSSSSDGRSSYTIDSYVLSKDNKKYLGIWDAKKQREEIADFFSDNTAVKTRILNKEFDKKIPELAQEYNRN